MVDVNLSNRMSLSQASLTYLLLLFDIECSYIVPPYLYVSSEVSVNYIVGVSEFWMYLAMSFIVGWCIANYLAGRKNDKQDSKENEEQEKEGAFTYCILEKDGQYKAVDTKRNIQLTR